MCVFVLVSARPYLTLTEKRWIAFQILCAMEQMETLRITHGDLKSSNVVLTCVSPSTHSCVLVIFPSRFLCCQSTFVFVRSVCMLRGQTRWLVCVGCCSHTVIVLVRFVSLPGAACACVLALVCMYVCVCWRCGVVLVWMFCCLSLLRILVLGSLFMRWFLFFSPFWVPTRTQILELGIHH